MHAVNMNKTYGLLTKVAYWLFIVFLVYLAFELARKIFGGSLGFEELAIGLLITNLGFSFYLKDSISKVDAKVTGHIGWHTGRDSKRTRRE